MMCYIMYLWQLLFRFTCDEDVLLIIPLLHKQKCLCTSLRIKGEESKMPVSEKGSNIRGKPTELVWLVASTPPAWGALGASVQPGGHL